jgi:hypothetical protein
MYIVGCGGTGRKRMVNIRKDYEKKERKNERKKERKKKEEINK